MGTLLKNRTKKNSLTKLIPIIILLLGLVAFFYFKLYNYISLNTLKTHKTFLITWVTKHAVLSSITAIVIYAIAVAISIPNAVFLTIMAGFLFGPIFGTLYVVTGATLGACIIFLAAKTAFYDLLYAKAGPWLKKVSGGFQDNVVSYMLFLRLVPLFPFWLVNIIPAFFGVKLRTYFITTFLGIIPGTFVYVLLGHGLGTVIDQNREINLMIIFKPEIISPIIGLALLALIPIVYKKIKKLRYKKNG